MFSQGLQHFTAEAVVPEQLLHYVAAVAGSRPLACAGFPAYLLEGHLVLVAYDAAMLETFSGGPDLEAATAGVKEATDAAARLEAVSVRQSAEAATAEGVQLRVDAAVDAALALPEVRQITVLAPVRPTRAPQDASTGTPDAYWDLELPLLREDGSLPWQKLRNMERRALRDVEVVREAWQPDHAALVQDFLRRKPFEPGTVHIFSHLESYVGSHPDVQLWAARHREDNSLQAFAVGDYASLTTAFYMFAFRRQDAVPGCADALLAGLVSEAEARGHMRFCLGLGIDPGIRFFKCYGISIFYNFTFQRSYFKACLVHISFLSRSGGDALSSPPAISSSLSDDHNPLPDTLRHIFKCFVEILLDPVHRLILPESTLCLDQRKRWNRIIAHPEYKV